MTLTSPNVNPFDNTCFTHAEKHPLLGGMTDRINTVAYALTETSTDIILPENKFINRNTPMPTDPRGDKEIKFQRYIDVAFRG